MNCMPSYISKPNAETPVHENVKNLIDAHHSPII